MSNLTDPQVRNMKPESVRVEILDANGLYLIVQPSGVKSFALRYRRAGKPVKLTLGRYWTGDSKSAPAAVIGGFLTLAGARKLAADTLHEVQQGRDPVAAKVAQRAKAAETFAAVAERFMEHEGSKLRTAHELDLKLKRAVLPTFGSRPIASIRKSDVVRLLDDIVKDRGPVAADRALALIRRIMNWHAVRSDDFRSPIVQGMARTKSSDRARDRILTDDELRAVWKTASDGTPFGSMVLFLLLTAARRTEASEMTWAEVIDGVWTLPSGRSKTGKAITRPLSRAALAVIEARPRINEFVFTFGGCAIANYSRPKERFDKACGVKDWTLHDLRRTAGSLMPRAGVHSDVAECCLGHVIPGVRGVYNRYKYEAEMLHAYEALASLIIEIVEPPSSDNIVPFHKAGE
jgi:integrase